MNLLVLLVVVFALVGVILLAHVREANRLLKEIKKDELTR
jgi:hypothetical protein